MIFYIPPPELAARMLTENTSFLNTMPPMTKGYSGELADIVPITRVIDPDEKKKNKKGKKLKA